MPKLNRSEFDKLISSLLVDALYPDYIHIPGLGVRISNKSFIRLSDDLYKSYYEQGETGIVLFIEKLKKRPDINIAVERTKKIIYSHLDTVGLRGDEERQKYVSGVFNSLKNDKT